MVRLPFIALFAVSTWLMYRLTALLFSRAAGLWAAAALNLAPVLGVTTGSWVLPDGPLIASRCWQPRFASLQALDTRGWGWWLGAGAARGMRATVEILGRAGARRRVLYLLTQPPAPAAGWRVRSPTSRPLLALLLFAPGNDLERARTAGRRSPSRASARWSYRLNPLGPLGELRGHRALSAAVDLAAADRRIRARRCAPDPPTGARWLLCCLAAGPVLLFPLVALWSRGEQFHWAAPGYLFLFPLLGRAA